MLPLHCMNLRTLKARGPDFDRKLDKAMWGMVSGMGHIT